MDFLKSGLFEENVHDLKDLNDDDLVINIISMYMVFIEDSIKIASSYSKHLGRAVISEKTTLRALKIRALHGEEFWNQSNIQNRIANIRLELKTYEDNSEEEEDEDEEYIFSFAPDAAGFSTCKCDVCKIFYNIDELWLKWNPLDVLEINLKKLIDKTDSEFFFNKN